jgi:glutamate racemase
VRDSELSKQPIGVFDSGIGGLSILRDLRAELPFEDFVYLADSGYAPYGERDASFVAARARAIAHHLLHRTQPPIKALVMACNTATAAAIHLLRQDHPELPIIGVEPALKPAVASSQTKQIGVLATQGTLGSQKFQRLLQSLADQAQFFCHACDGLADAIERNDATTIEAICAYSIRATGQFGINSGQMDRLVLGCTHYPFASDHLQALLPPGVALVSNGVPVARQTRRVLGRLASPLTPGQITLLSSGNSQHLAQAARRWLGLRNTVQTLPI